MRALAAATLALLGFATPALADRALIVGIDNYQDNQLDPEVLGASQADVQRIHKLLTGSLGYKEEDIRILVDDKATRAAVLDGVNGWLGESKPGERVFFYFAGQGHFAKGDDPKQSVREAIVPYDAAVNGTSTPPQIDNMVLDDELGTAFAKLAGRTITSVIDSCHSGTVTRGLGRIKKKVAGRSPQLKAFTRSIAVEPAVADLKASDPSPAAVPAGVDYVNWTAVSPTQIALIDEDNPANYHGVFTKAFADGIETGAADANHNGVISNQELLDYVRQQSEAYCKAHSDACEMGLTPALDGKDAALKVATGTPKPPVTDAPVYTDTPPPVSDTPVYTGALINQGKVTPDKILDLLGAKLSDDVAIQQFPPSPVHLGAKNIRFRVTSPVDGYLILLSVSDDGEVVQLFPNAKSEAHAKDGRIRAKSPITVPDAYYGVSFDATSVTKGTVIALVAVDRMKLSRSFLTRAIDVIPAEEVNTKLLPELAQSLATPAYKDDVQHNTKPVGRFIATLHYEIVP